MQKYPSIEPLKVGIKAIQQTMQKQRQWQKTFDKMFDGHFVPTYTDILQRAIIKILRDIYNDTDDILSWWIYEMDFGKSYKSDTMKDKNGHNIPIKTIDDLYRFFIPLP